MRSHGVAEAAAKISVDIFIFDEKLQTGTALPFESKIVFTHKKGHVVFLCSMVRDAVLTMRF
jgi:predicted hotdog family 3-hydroxylacyl-ACP dehydratase